MRSTSRFLLIAAAAAGLAAAGALAQDRGDAPTSGSPAPDRWPPHPARIVNLAGVDLKLPRKTHHPIYTVPQDKWLIVTNFEMKGPLGTRLAEVVEGRTPVMKLPGEFVGTESFGFKHAFRSDGAGLTFQPGSQVTLFDEGSSEVDWFLVGYLVDADS